MFDDTILTERAGDAALRALFREWCEAKRQYIDMLNDEEATAIDARAQAIERQICNIPAPGAAGLALKAYLLVHLHEQAWRKDNAALPEPEDSCMDNYVAQSIIRDAVRFVPELEPLAADFINEPMPPSEAEPAAFGPVRG
jgi:hypothetical protein